MKLSRTDYLAAGVVSAELVLAAYVARFGAPGPLPTHFNLAMRVDAWGDRGQLSLIIAAMALLAGAAYALLPALSQKRREGESSRGVTVARTIILTVSVMNAVLMAGLGLGLISPATPQIMPRLLMAVLALLFIVLGAQIGKSEPGPLVGVRTYWTLRSRLAWDKSNRLFGRLTFWGGLLALAASPIAPQPIAVQVLVIGVLAAAAVSAFESWRVWRGDPDRLAAENESST